MFTRLFEYISGKTINVSLTTIVTRNTPAEEPVTIFFGQSSSSSWSRGGQRRTSSTSKFTVPECDTRILCELLKEHIDLAESEPKKAGASYILQTDITFSRNTGTDQKKYTFDDLNSFETFLVNQGLMVKQALLLT